MACKSSISRATSSCSGLLIGSFLSFFTIPLSGFLSDRLGRKRVYIFGAIATGLFAFAHYAMFNTPIPALIILATMLAFFFHDMMWGPLAALTAEVFTPRLRYSGASIGFQLASVFAGDPRTLQITAIADHRPRKPAARADRPARSCHTNEFFLMSLSPSRVCRRSKHRSTRWIGRRMFFAGMRFETGTPARGRGTWHSELKNGLNDNCTDECLRRSHCNNPAIFLFICNCKAICLRRKAAVLFQGTNTTQPKKKT
jgi:MFS family permease